MSRLLLPINAIVIEIEIIMLMMMIIAVIWMQLLADRERERGVDVADKDVGNQNDICIARSLDVNGIPWHGSRSIGMHVTTESRFEIL